MSDNMIDYVDFTTIDTSVADRERLDVGEIFLNQGIAKCCNWTIRSKNRHHMASCRCGKSFIDGGSWYVRIGGNVELHTVLYKNLRMNDEDDN